MNKQQLAATLWASANDLRGKMDASEYKNYILGFLFYKFLSEHQENYLVQNEVSFEELDSDSIETIKEDLGYFYTDNIDYIINDLYDVTKYIKKKYKNKKIYLFSHSMGTLVARGYIQKYDNEIEKLILCGPPTKNELTKFAIKLSKLSNHTNKPNKLLNKLTFSNYSKDKSIDNSWLSKNIDNVNNYNEDELCGFIFTSNGFTNLYKLMDNAFQKENYKMQNKSLPIFLIAGSDDPVIQNENKFLELVDFLKELGYKNVTSKLYKDLKHEILNENEKEIIYKDILKFLNK